MTPVQRSFASSKGVVAHRLRAATPKTAPQTSSNAAGTELAYRRLQHNPFATDEKTFKKSYRGGGGGGAGGLYNPNFKTLKELKKILEDGKTSLPTHVLIDQQN